MLLVNHNTVTTPDEERLSNPLLLALKHGGALHKIVASAGTFDAVLCPTTKVLRQSGLDAVLAYHTAHHPQARHSTAALASSSSLASLDGSSSSMAPAPSSAGSSTLQGVAQHPATWFVLSHLIRFDNRGMSVEFSTLSGRRGAFSDALDSVFCAGVPGRCTVLRHLDPHPAQSQDAHRSFEPSTLNIFLIDGIVVDEDVVKRCKQALAQQQQSAMTTAHPNNPVPSIVTSSAAVPVRGHAPHVDPAVGTHSQTSGNHQQPSPSTLSRFIGSVTGSWMGGLSPATSNDSTVSREHSATNTTSAPVPKKKTTSQEAAIQYPEFQRLMLVPASLPAAKALHTFVDRVVVQDASSSAATASGEGSLPVDDIAREISGFTQQLMGQIRKMPHWKSYDTVAREGIEKYITSKLYVKLFGATWAEKQKDATLKRKMSLLLPVIDFKKHLDGPDGVESTSHWAEAVAAIREINDFRSPRDKMECVMKMCELVHKSVVEAANATKAALKDTSDAASAVGGASAFGADDILPSMMYCVLCANVNSLHSNLTFIERFRDKELLEPHGEYNLTCLQSCAQFWLTCQAHHLHLTEDAFDAALGNVYAKPHSKTHRGSHDGHHGSSTPPPQPMTRISTGELTVDALFADTRSTTASSNAPALHFTSSHSSETQTDFSSPPGWMAHLVDLAAIQPPAAEATQHLPQGGVPVGDAVVRVADVLDVLSNVSDNDRSTCDETFDSMTVLDLRRAMQELQQLRLIKERLESLCATAPR